MLIAWWSWPLRLVTRKFIFLVVFTSMHFSKGYVWMLYDIGWGFEQGLDFNNKSGVSQIRDMVAL